MESTLRENRDNSLAICLCRRDDPFAIPSRGREGDAGLDIYSNVNRIIWPKCTVDLDSGWDIKIPEGYWGTIKPRSSTFKYRGLVVFEGVIDSNYTGKLSVLVWNPGWLPKFVRRGDRLAQLILTHLPKPPVVEVNVMPITVRGPNGFGSSGR